MHFVGGEGRRHGRFLLTANTKSIELFYWLGVRGGGRVSPKVGKLPCLKFPLSKLNCTAGANVLQHSSLTFRMESNYCVGYIYRPRQGNVFTPVCQSFCSPGGGMFARD